MLTFCFFVLQYLHRVVASLSSGVLRARGLFNRGINIWQKKHTNLIVNNYAFYVHGA